MAHRELFVLSLLASMVGCTVASTEDVATGEQGIEALEPILGRLAGTTPSPDFSPEDMPPTDFPVMTNPPFPGSKAASATIGETVVLGSDRWPNATGMMWNRSTAAAAARYSLRAGTEVEFCAQAATGRAKLWLYRTVSGGCGSSSCTKPYELDETARAKNVGDTVCTRGRIPSNLNGPVYAVVDQDPWKAGTTVTLTTRAIALPRLPEETGPFAESYCTGPRLRREDVSYEAKVVGSFESAARSRECNKFRGCLPWVAGDPARVLLGSGLKTVVARGSVAVVTSHHGNPMAMLLPTGYGSGSWRNRVDCEFIPTLGNALRCSDENSDTYYESDRMFYEVDGEGSLTKTCVRTVARAAGPEADSEHGETEVALFGRLSLP